VYINDEDILCINKAKNVVVVIAKSRLFNEINVQKNKSGCIDYFITNPNLKTIFIYIF